MENDLENQIEKIKHSQGSLQAKDLPLVFSLFDVYIGSYRLNKLDKLIEEVTPIVTQVGGEWLPKLVQMLAFLRFKQFRFKESLAQFLIFESMMGASPELLENMGHTYNSLGETNKAEECFTRAIKMLEENPQSSRVAHKGGLLMGLGVVNQKSNKYKEALKNFEDALEWYRKFHEGKDHSLIAKAHVSCGKVQEAQNAFAKAEVHFAEAVRIFRITCGNDSPLTGNALSRLGTVQLAQDKYDLAQASLAESLKWQVTYDNINMTELLELVTKILELHTKRDRSINQSLYKPYIQYIKEANVQMKKQNIPSDDTVAVFNKTGGELCLLAGEFVTAKEMIQSSLDYLKKVTYLDVSSLIESCEAVLAYIKMKEK
eukprot:TRINITY_DN1748_c0_g2_i1.p1 TRINITY_DN1748_c0_g2~~TRINITY_DN1748_c0_g2_i1.p1  ORF type:complete len:383 (-),score=40.06 TRINITY_DN1748_c0_g2_i1:15-1133(-)